MKIEYEATFINIDKDEIREKLQQNGAKLATAEVLMRRAVFYPPSHIDKSNGYLRVRDEGYGKITMTFKVQINGAGIETERESEIRIESFEDGIRFLQDLGYEQKSSQESLREVWEIDDVEIMIDTWPFVETYVEIESDSEEKVRKVAEKLGFDWNDARFGASLAPILAGKYDLTLDEINNQIPEIKFGNKNPFLEFRKIKNEK